MKKVKNNKTQYIVFVCDHSGSMASYYAKALTDFNSQTNSFKKAYDIDGIETFVSVIEFGGGINISLQDQSLTSVRAISHYSTGGMTPLFDAVGLAITTLINHNDYNNKNASFLVMVLTDGAENTSRKWDANSISKKIKELQITDRWTFAFRVPVGHKSYLANLGIPSNNILEWEQTEEGYQRATEIVTSSIMNYRTGVFRGISANTTFYADTSNLSRNEVKTQLDDISLKVATREVKRNTDIKNFCEYYFGEYVKGRGFYKLAKSERVQPQKSIAIRDKSNGRIYEGDQARNLLGLPADIHIRLKPGYSGSYDIFVQSTSVNRKLEPGSEVLYWRP